MKQNISIDDLQELTEEQKEKLREMWEPMIGDIAIIRTGYLSYGCVVLVKNYFKEFNTVQYDTINGEGFGSERKEAFDVLLSIGQMIEILSEHSSLLNIQRYDDCHGNQWNVRGTLIYKQFNCYYETLEGDDDLCKALWCAVKNIL